MKMSVSPKILFPIPFLVLLSTKSLAAEVAIDIQPRVDEVTEIDPQSEGRLSLAILSTEAGEIGPDGFQALQVRPRSIRIGPDEARLVGWPRYRDVDRDGDVDMLVRFAIEETGITCGDENLQLTARTFSGADIWGSDAVSTVNCDSGGGDELPDLTADIGADPSCESIYPGVTRHIIGDLSFSDGVVSGTETYYYFGNSEWLAAGRFSQCSATYNITGTHGPGPIVPMSIQANQEVNGCPMPLPNSFNSDYLVELVGDGTANLSFSGGGEFAAGYWIDGRVVYAAPIACEFY